MVTLLDELRRHSIIDLDCNDEAGLSRMFISESSVKAEDVYRTVALDFKPFQDMTSNQLIVLGQLKQPSHASVLPAACKAAHTAKDQFSGISLEDLVVDCATVLLGKVVANHLHPEGYVHVQTLPSLAFDTDKTVQHALRLVALYGTADIPSSRVCIKIPSTAQGIEACRILESQHNVRTLATTCFTLAQALKAQIANCTYVAPYVNPLIVHLEPEKHIAYKDPLQELTGMKVTFDIQRAYKADAGVGKTKVLAASLVTAEECFALCGIEHITLSSAALALLQKTPLDERFEGIRDRSLAYLRSAEGPQRDGNNGFWTTDLKAALADPEVDSLQTDALKQFTIAEDALRSMAKEALNQSDVAK